MSCIRLAGAPVFIFLFVSPARTEQLASLPLLLLLLATDLVDGFLARRWQVTSNFGYVLDGVADRSAHIGMVIALTARGTLSPVLAFLLVFRDLVLYAARAFFDNWWRANTMFRGRVKLAAVLFKLTVGSIALLSYIQIAFTERVPPEEIAKAIHLFVYATWAFAAWSYILLIQQIAHYASEIPE